MKKHAPSTESLHWRKEGGKPEISDRCGGGGGGGRVSVSEKNLFVEVGSAVRLSGRLGWQPRSLRLPAAAADDAAVYSRIR